MNHLLNLFPQQTTRNHPCDQLVIKWVYSLLLDFNIVARSSDLYMDDIFTTIGLQHLNDVYDDMSKKELRAAISKHREPYQHRTIEDIDPVVATNMQRFATILGLSKTEQQLLLFLIVLKSHPTLIQATEALGKLMHASLFSLLADLLSLDYDKVIHALSNNGVLVQSGIVTIMPCSTDDVEELVRLNAGFAGQMMLPHNSILSMLSQYFISAKQSELTSKDFPHIKQDIQLIRDYLKGCKKQSQQGVNILLYGEPGTGKTELASLLIQQAGLTAYAIASSDTDGEDITGQSRFNAYQLGQQVLKKQGKAAILFDEIEDVFPSSISDLLSGSKRTGKAWVNQLLENTNVPTIWISNNIQLMDNAYLRRFDFVLELKTPPKSIRKTILNKYFGKGQVSQQWLDQMADNPDIAPALVSRAAKVVGILSTVKRAKVDNYEREIETILGNTLVAMGYKDLSLRNQHNTFYTTSVLNPDHDIKQLIEGLRRHQQARLCLYGPPGTGKTGFGHHLANKLDKPLLVKRASDLLDKYIGGTEKNLAAMFAEAEQEQAILLLDEADSFLQDRQSAQQQWQVTQVNELLTQMEAYKGIFICTTNLVNSLDEASIRRFDLKIKLDYMQPIQVEEMFRLTLKHKGIAYRKNPSINSALRQLSRLTPGDFATVVRKNRLSAHPLNANALLTGLQKEAAFKHSKHSRGIGFTSSIQ